MTILNLSGSEIVREQSLTVLAFIREPPAPGPESQMSERPGCAGPGSRLPANILRLKGIIMDRNITFLIFSYFFLNTVKYFSSAFFVAKYSSLDQTQALTLLRQLTATSAIDCRQVHLPRTEYRFAI